MLKSLVSIMLVAALVAGCGDDAAKDATSDGANGAVTQDEATPHGTTAESSTTAGAELKGCGLITEAEATAALGAPTKYRSSDGSDNCVLDATEAGGPTVDFQVFDGTDTYDAQAAGEGVETVAGVGDKAVFSSMGMMSQFIAMKGNRTLVATITGGNAAEHRAKSEALAKVILGKI